MKYSHLLFTLLLTILISAYARTPEAQADQVKELDGYYNFTNQFEMYSGYLTIQQ
jgi:hypothetical protein